jgi:hypothetical protein
LAGAGVWFFATSRPDIALASWLIVCCAALLAVHLRERAGKVRVSAGRHGRATAKAK